MTENQDSYNSHICLASILTCWCLLPHFGSCFEVIIKIKVFLLRQWKTVSLHHIISSWPVVQAGCYTQVNATHRVGQEGWGEIALHPNSPLSSMLGFPLFRWFSVFSKLLNLSGLHSYGWVKPKHTKIKHTERPVDSTEEIRQRSQRHWKVIVREIVMNMLTEGHRRKPSGVYIGDKSKVKRK